MMEIVTRDFPSIQQVEVRKFEKQKIEFTVDKIRGDVILSYADMPEGGGTWFNKTLFIGRLTNKGLVTYE